MGDKSLEDLLNIIDQAQNKQQRSVATNHESSVDRFVTDLNIKTGLDKIPTHVIFYHYSKKWQDLLHKKKKVNKIVFFRAFNKKFTQSRTGKQRYYLLDKESFDLSRESLLEAEHFDRKLAGGKKEKRKMGQS